MERGENGKSINKMADEELDEIDKITEQLGFGRWTVLMLSSFVCWGLVLPYFSVGGAFFNPNVDHWCTEKNISEFKENFTNIKFPDFLNSSNVWVIKDGKKVKSQCEEYDLEKWLKVEQAESFHGRNKTEFTEENMPRKSCDSWQYDQSTFTTTVSTEWDLVCGTAGISPFFQSFYYFGITIGEPLLGYLSDRFGRRWVIRRVWFLFLGSSIVSVSSPKYFLLLAMRFLLGIVHAGSSVAYVLVLETCPSKHRSKTGLFVTASFALTGIVFGGLAYFIREWRYLQAVCIIPGLLHLLYLPFIDESPRWLLHNGRTDEGIKTLKRAAKWHGVQLAIPERFTNPLPDLKRDGEKPAAAPQPVNDNYLTIVEMIKRFLKDFFTLVGTPAIRRITLAMFGCWFVVGLSYWGMSLAGGSFSSDPFLYMILQSVMEVPGYTWIIPLLWYIGRKTTLALNFFGCAFCMLIMLAIPEDMMWLTFTFALIGKLFITASYNLLYLYSVELFPTCVRSRGFNISSMMARIASISSPFVITLLANAYSWAPSVVFGSAALLGTLLAFTLPETKGKPLLDTVEHVEQVYGHHQTLQVIEKKTESV